MSFKVIEGESWIDSKESKKVSQVVGDIQLSHRDSLLNGEAATALANQLSSILKRKVKPKDIDIELSGSGKTLHLDISLKFRINRFVKKRSNEKADLSIVK